jgi:hypothetical protein
MRRLLCLSGLALLLLAVAAPARAFEITQVIPKTNPPLTACMDVKGANTANGTPVEAYPCNGYFNEQWRMDGSAITGTGGYGAKTTCLAIVNGLAVLANPCPSAGAPIEFNLGVLEGGNGDCFDSQGKYGSGAQIAVTSCAFDASQTWIVRDIVFTQPIPKKTASACIDVAGGATATGTAVNAASCTLGPSERWSYVSGALQSYDTASTGPVCLDVNALLNVVVNPCNGSGSQQWYVEPVGASGVLIQNRSVLVGGIGNGCLDSSNGTNGEQLVLYFCNAGIATELWSLR